MYTKPQRYLPLGCLMALWIGLWACAPTVPSQQSCQEDRDCSAGYACVFGACSSLSSESGRENIAQISDANTHQPDIPQEPPCRESDTRPCFPRNQKGCTSSQGSFSCTQPCNTGTQTCSNGLWGECIGAVVPTPEECNGKDDDCDGQIDNNLAPPLCAKQSGLCKGSTKQTCDGKNGWKECDQAAYTKHHDAYEPSETRCDGLDNDCDGQADNNLPPKLCDKQSGVCGGTKATCGGKNGWKPCDDATYKAQVPEYSDKEECDGKDNNCDGQIDEGCSCVNNETQPCFPGNIGCKKDTDNGTYQCNDPCKTGTQTCSGGKWGSCEGASIGKPEECNGIDDDCDGKIDNDLTAPACENQKGVCNGSKKICDGKNGWKKCDQTDYTKHSTDYEVKETKCDGLDNDCDENIDNGLTAPKCLNQNGVCKDSTQTCKGKDGWKDCDHAAFAAHSKTYEINETLCDGLDNDCDGKVDNGLTPPTCTKQNGVCNGSKKTCDGIKGWVDCDTAAYTAHNADYEATETKCDGKDNDCDGSTDKHCDCQLGQSRECFGGSNGCTPDPSSIGSYQCNPPCQVGKQECVGGKWGDCVGDVREAKEICDGIDNDCDGKVDNNLTPVPCDKQDGVCQGSTKVCDSLQKKWLDCDDARYKAHNTAYEATETLCDGLDNNCDGKADNNLPTQPCSNQKGVCLGANQTCNGTHGWKDCEPRDYFAHNNDYQPTETKCDNKDNDCDGQIDENIKRDTYPSDTRGCTLDPNTQQYKCEGICQPGISVCKAGQWQQETPAVTPQKEYMLCTDGKDNDCDGKVDYSDLRAYNASASDERDNCVSTYPLIQHDLNGQKEGQLLIKDIVSNASEKRGDLYLLGEITGTYRYLTTSGQNASIASPNGILGFIMKVTPEFRVHWAFTFSMPLPFPLSGSAQPQRLAYANNTIYITGSFQGTIRLPKGALSTTTQYESLTAGFTNRSAAFVWAIQDAVSQPATGLWASKIDYGDTTAHSIVANSQAVYVGGKSTPDLNILPIGETSGNDPFIAVLSTTDGAIKGRKFFKTITSGTADFNDRIWQMALFNGDLLAVGTFSGAYEKDTTNKIFSAGERDAFLVRLSLDLKTIHWFRRIHSAEDDTPTALHTEGTDIYVAGTSYLNVNTSSYKLTFEGGLSSDLYGRKTSTYNGFIARYKDLGTGNPNLEWAYLTASSQRTGKVVPTAIGMRDGLVHLVGSYLEDFGLYQTSTLYSTTTIPVPITGSTLVGSTTQVGLFLLLLDSAGTLVSPVRYPALSRTPTNPMSLHDTNRAGAHWLANALAFDVYGMDYLAIGFASTQLSNFDLNPLVWSNLSLRSVPTPNTLYQKGAFPRKSGVISPPVPTP